MAEALQRARFTRSGSDLSGTIAHSDRGCQYTSAAYRHDLKLLQMTQSMSRTANCYDNATMEWKFDGLLRQILHQFANHPRVWQSKQTLIGGRRPWDWLDW